jgi:hypothetical protein
MKLVDKYGYLEETLNYIETHIINQKGWTRICSKLKIKKEALEDLAKRLKNFSENYLFKVIEEKLEKRHSSIAGDQAELYSTDLTIEMAGKKAFIQIIFKWKIVEDEEEEDRVTTNIKIIAKDNIVIKITK